MNTEEMMKMCDKLSYKYKTTQMRQDLVQEGVLACLEVLAVEDSPHPAKLYRAADKAMWDYLNFSGLPVTMPITGASRSAMKGEELDDTQTYSDDGVEALREAVASTSVQYDDADISVPDHAEEYERIEYDAYVASKVVTVLSKDELEIIKLRYYADMSQEEVASVIGVSQKTVSRREEAALKKLKKHLS